VGQGELDSQHAAEAAYEAIAPVYDAFTADYDYALWLGNVLPKLESRGIAGRRLLDVACGTGKSFIPMLENGWEVTACDISASMLAIAQEKVGDKARLEVADMRDLPAFGEFDVVWCLDDSINYLLNTEELGQALSGMRRNLSPSGLLLFDLNTLETYRTFFAEDVVLERAGMRMTWTGMGDPNPEPGSLASAIFSAEPARNGTAPTVAPHVHHERHFPEADVLAALRMSGFGSVEVYGHHHDVVLQQPLDERAHTKAVYIVAAA